MLSECLGRLLYIAPSSTTLVLLLGVEQCRWASESAGQVSLPVTCQAASITQHCHQAGQMLASDLPSCEHYAAWQAVCDMSGMTWSRRGHHCRKTWPKGSFHFSQCTEFPTHREFKLMSSPDLELGALTKKLASRMLVWVSRQASLHYHYFYCVLLCL